MLQLLSQLLCVPPCHLVTSNETFQQQMCTSGVDGEVALISFDSTCSLCGVPMGARCSPSIVMHIGHLASTTMAQQDQEGGITCITYLSNIVKTMFYNALQCFTNTIRDT